MTSTTGRGALRVLLVDDDPMVLAMSALMLDQIGVGSVEQALNGSEALAALAAMTQPPDIIISDLNMPGMDGVELLRHVAERRVGAGVIISSGEEPRMLATVHALALQHGLTVLGVLPKPMTPKTLVKMLNDFSSLGPTAARAGIARITEEELIEGLAAGHLSLVYQPKVLCATRALIGFEALARWNHPTRGTLPPPAFIQLAEETGHIGTLTREAIRLAVAECGRWHAAGMKVSVSVNVTADDLEDITLPDFAQSCASAAHVHPSNVIFEVTESRIMKNLRATMETLSRLRLKNFGLSIDDFGTGYASLEQLTRAPFTEVKVDRAFVHGAANDSTTRAILESSVALGQKLKLHVVAEGVEMEEDWRLLAALDCEIVQGYIVAKPIASSDLPGWVANWSALHAQMT